MLLPTLYLLSAAFSPISCAVSGRSSTCFEASLWDASWQVTDWNPDYEDPASGGQSDGSVHFRIRNTANDYTVQCVRRGEVSMCFWVSGPEDDIHETSFVFDQTAHTLAINQTWSCPAEDGSDKPYVLRGSGIAAVKAQCTKSEQDLGDVICGQQGGLVHAIEVTTEEL
ncbi:hypothetical protein QBC43DRAFT_352761 [Cladorrhinum sp. PSN259]|nr:hypothetical protein QBC43DRAFT_352761 [Cladorrhinum sp. PSN259]